MRKIKKLSMLISILLFIAVLLIGCSFLPEEYTKGIKLDRDYPTEVLPIMDDALIYYYEDDGDITVKFGINDGDIDDIKDFYQDYFSDTNIYVEEDEGGGEYSANGYILEYKFKLDAKDPRTQNEQKAFAAIVKIKIEIFEEDLKSIADALLADDLKEAISTKDLSTVEQHIIGGLWRVFDIEAMGQNSVEQDPPLSDAFGFLEDGTLNVYENFELTEKSCSWYVSDTAQIIISGDITYTFVAYIGTEDDGEDYMITTDGKYTKYWERISYLDFLQSGEVGLQR